MVIVKNTFTRLITMIVVSTDSSHPLIPIGVGNLTQNPPNPEILCPESWGKHERYQGRKLLHLIIY